jgi:ABC-type cobalamin/Fe3+-siderophores transport system ATPase subunit
MAQRVGAQVALVGPNGAGKTTLLAGRCAALVSGRA